MNHRKLAVVALITAAAWCATPDDHVRFGCASATAGGATTMRGQLELTFSVDDRGVAYHSLSRQQLRLELTIARDGSASLRVRGTVERQGRFISPAGPSQSRPTLSRANVDDRWVGRATRAHAVTRLKLALVTRDRDRDPLTFTLACKRTMEPLSGARTPKRVALQRCTPVTKYPDLPWNDPLPSYTRVPLVFAVRGDVLVGVVADHEHAGVSPPSVARP